MNLKSQVRGGVRWTTISAIALALSAILKVSILTRFLEKSDFGLVAIVTFILSFMELFNDMGISTAILHKQNITQKEYSSLYWINLLISLLLYGIVWTITPLVVTFYNQDALKSILPILGLNLIFAGIGRQFRVIYQKQLNFKVIALIDISAAILSIITAVYLAVQGYGIYSLVFSTLLQFFISNITFLLFGFKENRIIFFCNINLIKEYLKIGSYQVGGQIANYFNRDIDILIIGKLMSPSILGGYSLAKQLVFRPFQLVNPIIIKVASPVLAKFQSDKNDLKNNYLKLLNVVSSINIIIYALLIIFAPIIIDVFYGKGFENIYMTTRILCIYMILRSIGNPVGSLVVATGRTDLDLKWNFFTLFLMPIFVYLGSQFGINGVAAALSLSMVLLYYPSWKYMIYEMTNATFKEYFIASFKVDLHSC